MNITDAADYISFEAHENARKVDRKLLAEQRATIEQLEAKVKAYEGGCLHDILVAQAQEIARLGNGLGCSRSHPHEDMNQICELRTEAARLKNELSHWTWVRFKQLEEENATLRERDEIAKWYKAYIEQCEQEIARLREALENIVEGEGLWTKNDMAHEAQQALKETGK